MSLNIYDFERDIIVDEVIIQNKKEYLDLEIDLGIIKDILNFYIDEYLSKRNENIDFETVLGSVSNIGKLLLNFAHLGSEFCHTLNSHIINLNQKFIVINDEYLKKSKDLSKEIFAKEVFSVVPNYTMNIFSYVKLELLRSNYEKVEKAKANMHRLARVIELFITSYGDLIVPTVGRFKLMNEGELYSLGNLYLNFILYYLENAQKNIFAGRNYTLREFVNRKEIQMEDVLFFINSYPEMAVFQSLTLHEQLDIAIPYRWIPVEVRELKKLSDKILKLAVNWHNASGNINSISDSILIRDKIKDNVSKLRFALDNKYKKYYNRGIDLGGDYVLKIADDIAKEVFDDLDYMCGKKSVRNERVFNYLAVDYKSDTIEEIMNTLRNYNTTSVDGK